jgi:hypothetical protein
MRMPLCAGLAGHDAQRFQNYFFLEKISRETVPNPAMRHM